MILVNRILGHRSDAFRQSACDEMERTGKLETLLLEASQWQRARLCTQQGTVVGIDFRDLEITPHSLRPGSIVFYEEGRRIVLARVKNARVLVTVLRWETFRANFAGNREYSQKEMACAFSFRVKKTKMK